MAIIIEEEKKKMNWFAWIVAAAIVLAVGLSVYYLFFAPVPLIEKVIPAKLESIRSISQNEFTPDPIAQNPIFQILRQYINPVEPATSTVERRNPFIPIK